MDKKQMTQKTIKSGVLYRDYQVREHDSENRTAALSFSSDAPVERWFGREVLDHRAESVRLDRINGKGPLLMDHDHRDVVGVVESVSLDKGRGDAVVRFGKSARAEEIFQDVLDGIRSSVSVGYRVHKAVLEEQSSDEGETYRVVDWEPIEISLVNVPADTSVGVGRSYPDQEENDLVIESYTQTREAPAEVRVMSEEKKDAPTTVDVKAVADEARKQEQSRIREINAIGDKLGKADLARQFIDNGQNTDAFRAAVVESMGAKPVESADPSIGMSDKDVNQFSFMRAMRALANPTDRRAQKEAAFEFECAEAADEKRGVEGNGLRIPYDVLIQPLQRDLTVGTSTAGGHTVATDLLASSFIELLRNKMMIRQAGAQILDGLVGNIAIPRQTGGATGYWVAESGAPTESQQAFDQVALTPKTVGAYTDISRKLLLQSSIGVEAFVRNDLSRTLAIEIDRAAINGSGASNQPTGILQTSGIGSVAGGTDGLAPTWANIVGLESAVAIDNADVGALRYLSNAAVRGKLKTTLLDAGSGQFVWPVNGMSLNGYEALTTNQVPSNLTKGTGTDLSAIIFGNFSDLIVGEWGGLSLMVDPYTASTTGTVRVVALQDVDVAVRHPESFAAMVDAITV